MTRVGSPHVDVQDVRTLEPSATVRADVCIIGSGPAGLTVARELSGSGLDVLLLESGELCRDPWADALSAIENTGVPLDEDQSTARNRLLGGSSATWWGRLATFDDIDFAERAWVPGSGWPVSRKQLRPYFARALAHVGGTVADNNTEDVVAVVAQTIPGLDPALFQPYAWTYSQDRVNRREAMRFGARAGDEPMPGVRCLTSATVTHIGTTPCGDAVETLEVRSPDGCVRHVRATHVVLCAGGIENARLLLASNRVLPTGVGNAHDVVGRHLMDHPRGPVATYRREDADLAQRVLGEHRLSSRPGSTRLVPGISPSPRFQAAERLLNCAFWLDGVVAEDDPLSAVTALARWRSPARSLRTVMRGSGLLAEGLRRRVVGGRAALRAMSHLDLWCMVEQVPDPASRITLSERTDALGVPLPVVHWRTSELEAHTIRCATRRLAEEMCRLGMPVPELLPMVADDAAPFGLPDAYHPTGTTRMSLDPREGVVDPDCAVHGVRGLHVAGSSVFPTSGHANPTQMIVVLAVRLADRLKQLLGKQSALPA
jgi:choline dehydrogenase-like flavoprotein